MSHSTELSIEIGLDKFEINCGSRHPAEVNGASSWIRRRWTSSRTSQTTERAADQCELYGEDEGWLKIEIRHCL